MKNTKKVFIVGESMIKNINGTGISRLNTVKMRPHPGATTVDLCDCINVLCSNQKPHVDKNLRKAIKKRSQLKNKENRTKLQDDIAKYKKQRNLEVLRFKTSLFRSHRDTKKFKILLE